MNNLQEQLFAATEVLANAEANLQLSVEFLAVKEAKKLVYSLTQQLEKEKKLAKLAELNKNKTNLINLGFVCQTGHTTSASNHHNRTSDDGEPYTFLIIHSSKPKVENVIEWSNGISVTWKNLSDLKNSYPNSHEEWIVGYGETEKEAWEEAVYSWSNFSEEEKQAALN